jgi:hypothetical protein
VIAAANNALSSDAALPKPAGACVRMTAVGKISGRQSGIAWWAGRFGSTGTNQPPVMGEIRRGGRHFGVFLIPVTHDVLVTGAILLVAAEELPGEPWASKFIEGGGIGF